MATSPASFISMNPDAFVRAFLDARLKAHVTMCGVATCRTGRWAIGPRVIPDHMVYLVETGRIQACVGAMTEIISAPGCCWAQPGIRQQFELVGAGCAVIRFLRFNVTRRGAALRLRAPALCMPGIVGIRHLMMALALRIGQTRREPGARFLLGALTQAMVEAGTARRDGLRPALADRLAALVHECRGQVDPAGLARAAGMHPAYFARQFKRTFGIPPRRYLLKARLDLAEQMLAETNMNVAEIADQLGYRNIFLFSRQFRALKGMPPSRCRD